MSTAQNTENIIQYVPFVSFVNPSFWHSLTDLKIDVDKLNETQKQIYGRFTYRQDIGAVFEVDGTSFNKIPNEEQHYYNVTGILMNKNTIEEFKNVDKAELLNNFGDELWTEILNGDWIHYPNKLLTFFIFSFADLKKFHYYYWFAFPCPKQPTVYVTKTSTIDKDFNNKELDELCQGFKELDLNHKCFFIVSKEEEVRIKTISEGLCQNESGFDINKNYFAFLDASSGVNPGWPLRTFLAALIHHCPHLTGSDIKVIGIRCMPNGSLESSRVFYIQIPQEVQSTKSSGWVGWERNDKGNFGPKLANMSSSMDPLKLAETSSDLNIKLIKWRLVPNIDIDVMKTTKCLLLGAGTLGCHVARDLLAWGFRHITFIDNGKVSYSNPTRQVLFNFEDCINGGKKKALAAAENLKLILPTVHSKGQVVHIPMPGHPVGESLKEETISNINVLTDAIAAHDVIFLLLDTREARWLPTLIASYHGKIVINAALGFDSYLVMRHGVFTPTKEYDASLKKSFIDGDQLGCYFCNDVTAPGNSVKDRTLDQQCTVTRPGVAAIAGALAVEFLVGLLQHPLRIEAQAAYNLNDEIEKGLTSESQGVLGPIPHSIRGFLHSYQTVVPTCAKFKNCIACSNVVINKYKEEGDEFLLNVFNSGTYLETITGLSELHLAAEMTDILTLSDDED